MEVKVTRVTSWERVANAARMTVHKDALGKEPSNKFKAKILMAEHSPIRLLEYDIILKDIPFYVMGHLVRHKHGSEPFVGTSREDRTGIPRSRRSQIDLVDCQFSCNAQALINISRKRLCGCADAETRKVWKAVRDAIKEDDPILASYMIPECVYRGFCPELKCCGFAEGSAFNNIVTNYRNLRYEIAD